MSIGTAPSRKVAGADKEFLELCDIIDKILLGKSFAPISYYVKCTLLLLITFGIEFYVHWSADYKWQYTALLGWCYALIGLNIQHDANHGAISKNPLINRMLGLSQNFIGGSAIDWIHQHVVQHHINTNDVHHDPDIQGNIILRLNPIKDILRHHSMQHIYIFILITLFGFTTVMSAINSLIYGIRYTPMSKLVAYYRYTEMISPIFFMTRWVILPLVKNGVSALLATAPLYMVAGFYLAFFFILSHNFEGVHMFDKSKKIEGSSFLRNQVTSSSNVGGSWLCYINGGLNYQIEHHLFPRIQHTYYPIIAPAVRAFCESRDIKYVHFPTIYENFISCNKHLKKMSVDRTPPIPGH